MWCLILRHFCCCGSSYPLNLSDSSRRLFPLEFSHKTHLVPLKVPPFHLWEFSLCIRDLNLHTDFCKAGLWQCLLIKKCHTRKIEYASMAFETQLWFFVLWLVLRRGIGWLIASDDAPWWISPFSCRNGEWSHSASPCFQSPAVLSGFTLTHEAAHMQLSTDSVSQLETKGCEGCDCMLLFRN